MIDDVEGGYHGKKEKKKSKKKSKKSLKKHGRHYKDHYYEDPFGEDNYWDLYERKIRGEHVPPYYHDYRDEWDGHYPYSYNPSSKHHALDHPLKAPYRYRDDYGYDDLHHLWRDGYPKSDSYGHDDLALNAQIDHAVKKELGEGLGEIDKKAESAVEKLDKVLKK